MIEYAMYRRFKSKREKDGRGSSLQTSPTSPLLDEPAPVLTNEDEAFLATLVDEPETRPTLPPRLRTPQLSFSDDELATPPAAERIKGKSRAQTVLLERPDAAADDKAKHGKLAFLFRQADEASTALTLRIPAAKMQLQKILPGRSASTSQPQSPRTAKTPTSPQPVPEYEEPEDAQRKKEDDEKKRAEDLRLREAELAAVLDDLNISAKGNRAFSISAESADMARKFNLVLRDLTNGVPTAYGDLTHLLDDKDGTLNKAFDKLPAPMKKMVEQLPEKITGSLGPEVLVAAAEAGGIKVAMDHSAAKSGKKGAAKKAMKSGAMSMLTPGNLHKLVTKPGAVASMLRAIVAALKTRWPAIISTNILFSVAVFLLFFVLWYCYKRGREVRLEREGLADGDDKADGRRSRGGEVEYEIEEVDDLPRARDPALLPAPGPKSPVQGSGGGGGGSRSGSEHRRRRRHRAGDDPEYDSEKEERDLARERRRERERFERGDDRDRGDGRRERDGDRDRDDRRWERDGDRDRDDRRRERDGDRDRDDRRRDRDDDRDRDDRRRDRDYDRDRDDRRRDRDYDRDRDDRRRNRDYARDRDDRRRDRDDRRRERDSDHDRDDRRRERDLDRDREDRRRDRDLDRDRDRDRDRNRDDDRERRRDRDRDDYDERDSERDQDAGRRRRRRRENETD